MKIAVVVGGAWHAPQLSRALQEMGHDVHVFSTDRSAFRGLPVTALPLRLVHRVAARLPTLAPLVYSVFSRAALPAVRRFKPDVMITWSGFGKELAPVHAVRVLVRGSHHIRTQAEILRGGPSGTRKPSPGMIKREMHEYRVFDFVTVPTPEIARDPAWGDTRLIVSAYGMPKQRQQQHRSAPAEGLVGLFVGAVSWRKGADLLDRIADCEHVSTVRVIGPKVDSLNFSNKKLKYEGARSQDEVASAMASSHFLALLSREEGQARVGLEALASGLPLLVTRRSGLSRYCEEFHAGIVVSDEPSRSEIGRAIQLLADNWREYADGARAASMTWNWRDHAQCIIAAVTGMCPP